MGSLLEELVVQLVPRQGWRMAEARQLLDRAEIRYNTLSGPGQNVGLTNSDYQGLWFIA